MLEDRPRVSLATPWMTSRPLEYEDLEDPRPEGPAVSALPALCMRRLQMPSRHGCESHCPGVQPDGQCLCEVVQDELTAGRQPLFEVDKEGFWCLAEREWSPGVDRLDESKKSLWSGWDGE